MGNNISEFAFGERDFIDLFTTAGALGQDGLAVALLGSFLAASSRHYV